MPSQFVYTVVSIVEKFARKEMCLWSSLSKDIVLKVQLSVLQEARSRTLHSLEQH